MGVGDDTDDGRDDRRRVGFRWNAAQMLADRILVRPKTFGQALVDDHDRLFVCEFFGGEIAAGDQSNPDRVEIGGGENAAHVGGRLAPAGRRRLSFDRKPRHAQARERQAIGKAGALDAGQRRDFLESLAAKRGDLRVVRVMRSRHAELHREQMVRAKTRIDVQDGEQAFHHERGANEQHARERDFRDDEHAPRPSRGGGRLRAAGLIEKRVYIRARGQQRGNNSKEDAGGDRNQHRENKHGEIEMDIFRPVDPSRLERHEQFDPEMRERRDRAPRPRR